MVTPVSVDLEILLYLVGGKSNNVSECTKTYIYMLCNVYVEVHLKLIEI